MYFAETSAHAVFERAACIGMVADKHKVDAKKAEALGMLLPKTGLTALACVLRETASGVAATSLRGAANLVYWRSLLANVKPTPPIFADIMAAPQTASAGTQEVSKCLEETSPVQVWYIYSQGQYNTQGFSRVYMQKRSRKCNSF